MANRAKVLDSIKSFLLKMKALDEAIPEELAQDALEMTEEVKDALEENEVADEDITEKVEDACETEDTDGDIEKKVEDAFVKVMHKYGLIKDESMEALEKAEDECEIVKDADGEEDVTVDPEKMNDSMRRELIRKIKPVIANVKDRKDRKMLADSFAEALNMSRGSSSIYGDILNISKSVSHDAMYAAKRNDADFGMEIAKKYNPHYKED